MTLSEAAKTLSGCALIVWTVDDKQRQNSLFHIEVQSRNKTICGRETVKTSSVWMYQTISLPELDRYVTEQVCLCSECLRLIAMYDFSLGKEPSPMEDQP